MGSELEAILQTCPSAISLPVSLENNCKALYAVSASLFLQWKLFSVYTENLSEALSLEHLQLLFYSSGHLLELWDILKYTQDIGVFQHCEYLVLCLKICKYFK